MNRALLRARALGAFLLALVAAKAARAELADDVELLRSTFARGGRAEALAPRVVHQGNILPLFVPGWATADRGAECTTVAVLGAVSTSFVVRFLPSEEPASWERLDAPQPSVAGAVQLVRCGRQRRSLATALVEVRSPRGVIQVVVGRSPKPPLDVHRVLPHRDPGRVAPVSPGGPRPKPGRLEERLALLGARYTRERAVEFHRRLIPSSVDGTARVLFELPPGCHRIHVLGIGSEEESGLDLDAELAFRDSHEFVLSDRSDSPDAGLFTCTGEDREAILTFAGATPSTPVLVAHARWDMPKLLPAHFEPDTRGEMARALFRHRLQDLDGMLVYESLGIGGATLLPVEVEPGACYVGVVTGIRGEVQLLSLSVDAARSGSAAHATPGDPPPLIAFCAGARRRVRIEVEAHGTSYYHRLALFRTGTVRIEGAP